MKFRFFASIPDRFVVALTLLPALGLAGCSDPSAPTMAETVRPAYVAEVRAGGHDGLRFIGEVRAARRAELAFPVSGSVAEVRVEVGDSVRAGQVLATLDMQPLRSQLVTAQSDVARTDAQLAELRKRHERVRKVQEAGAASAAELGDVQAELAATAAALRGAQAQRDLAAWSLAHASLRAPVSGVIGARLIEPGQATGPGAPVLTIDGDGRELSIAVPDSLALTQGQTVILRSGATTVSSEVLRIGGRLDAGGVRRVFLRAPANAAVGSTWEVSVTEAGRASNPQIPLRAVLHDTGTDGAWVLRIAKDGRTVERVPVALGKPHGQWIEVTRGLARGDRVVVAGAVAIRPGSIVKPVAYKTESRS